MYRYLCTQRPPVPGAIPHGAANVEYLDCYVEDAGGHPHYVYGAVEYDGPLSDKQVDDYELVPDGEG